VIEQLRNLSIEELEALSEEFSDLKEGMPDNLIIDASIQLYEDNVRLDLQA